MYEKTRAIVLRIHKLDDERRILEVYTETRGFLSFRLNQNSGKKSRMRNPFFLPLNILELEFDYRERLSIQLFNEVSLLSSVQTTCFNPYKSAIVLFLAEFLTYILRKEPQNVLLFSFLFRSFVWLAEHDSDFMSFHLLFVTQMTCYLGIPPFMDSYSPGSYFDLQDSTFTHVPPVHGQFIQPEYATLLSAMYRADYNTMKLLILSRQDRKEYLYILVRYYQIHFPGFPEMKSLTVLSELFD